MKCQVPKKKKDLKTQQHHLFPGNMAQLLLKLHRPCCEEFKKELFSFCQTKHHTEGNELMKERLMPVTRCDVNKLVSLASDPLQ